MFSLCLYVSMCLCGEEKMFSKEQSVEVSDTRKLNSCTIADNQKIIK